MTIARGYIPSDDAELVRLASQPMPGWARLRYDYASGYAAAEELKGNSEIVVVVDGEGCIAGCGTRSTRLLYLDGEPRRIAYLSGLRSFVGGRRKFGLYRGFQKIQALEQSNPAELTFTTILDGNLKGHALLTSGRTGLPKYRPRGRVVTCALSPRRFQEPEMASFDELQSFYGRESPRKQLFPVFGRSLPAGLAIDDYLVLRRNGRIVAAGAVWRHGARRRIFVDGYGTGLRVVRPALNLALAFAHCPVLPAPGNEFPCAYLAYALAENDDSELFARLVDAARRACRGMNLVLSLHSDDPSRKVVASMGGWSYGSEFLTVEFGGRERRLDGVPYIEAGAL